MSMTKKADIAAQMLMNLAKTKYKTTVQEGSWNALSKEVKQIIPLTAKIDKLQRA